MATGRPLTLGMTHRVREDGSRLTVGDAIVEALRAGNYIEVAASQVGVGKTAVYEWLARGARARRQSIRSGDPVPPSERIFVGFADAVEEAQAVAEARDVALLASLARGGIVQEVITETVDAEGHLVNRKVERRRTLPDAKALMWRLERRFTSRWGHQGSLEVTGAGGEPLIPRTDRASALADEMRTFLAGAAAAGEVERAEQANGHG